MGMPRPLSILRLIFRLVLYSVLAYLLLIIAWVALPSPSPEAAEYEASYSASRLLSGKGLTRVYLPASTFSLQHPNHREGVAIDYHLKDLHTTPKLVIPGLETPLLLVFPADTDKTTNPYQHINITVHTGDTDGVNLPWFHPADAVLLYWQIHRETVTLPVVATWSVDGQTETLRLKGMRGAKEELLVLSMTREGDEVEVGVDVPPSEGDWEGVVYKAMSYSPSSTYLIRVFLITIIAPSAIFLNKNLGPIVAILAGDSVLSTAVLFTVAMYVFLISTVVVSIYRCFGIRSRRMDDLVEKAERNGAMRGFLRVCKEGWHPERDSRRRGEEESERRMERGEGMGIGSGVGGGAKRVLDQLLRESRGRGVNR